MSGNLARNMLAKRSIALVLGLWCIGGLSAAVRADDHSIVAAATANAVDSLRDEVAAERIDSRLTVAEFLKKTGGDKQLREVLQRAEELGGPRISADGQACQIRVQINGDRVARELVSIAASHPKQSPIPAELISRELADWENRVFTGTGSSVSAGSAKFIRPSVINTDDAWIGVSDATRQQAVDAARDNATHQAIQNLSPLQFTTAQTLGSVLSDPTVSKSLSTWLASQPVRQVRFTPQHEVELTLFVEPNELCKQLLLAVHQANLPAASPTDEAALRKQFSALPSEIVGRATASTSTTSTAPAAIDLPAQPPAWTEEVIVAEGIAEARNSKLKTARAAESAARVALRNAVNLLRISETLTVGQAAEGSPAIERSVDRCIDSSRPFKVDYRADGSVLVRSTINSRELWMAITHPE